jgi:U4/U6 small nuclear ribonucleoprotein PRP4
MMMNQGNIMQSSSSGVEVMDLTEDSAREKQKHDRMLLELEIKKHANQMNVPTLPEDVKQALRRMGQPIRFFGENLADVRNRLRIELARRELYSDATLSTTLQDSNIRQQQLISTTVTREEEEITKYTRASQELIHAREKITTFSLERAKLRLDVERRRRLGSKRILDRRLRIVSTSSLSSSGDAPGDIGDTPETDQEHEVHQLDMECSKLYRSIRTMGLEGSQYGDTRALSAITTFQMNGDIHQHNLIATGSWSSTIKVWDANQLDLLGVSNLAHEDRIMGIAVQGVQTHAICCTASIDLTAKLWKFSHSQDAMIDDTQNDNHPMQIECMHVLKGHAARLCRTAFHPLGGQYVATTSFDHTWRLWDVETGSQLLLQDGHAREVYGIGFHPDGSLVATTDFGSVVHNWDLRTGKAVYPLVGQHAQRILCAEYSPNGFHLATAGDDGILQLWDLRHRSKRLASVPAHSKLVTQLRFAPTDTAECLVSSSFDGTAKVWSTRDWKILSTLRGHEGKVMGLGIVSGTKSVVTTTCGYDKTIKLWK